MANLNIRNLPDAVHAALRHRAVKNHRSTEAEIRAILSAVAANELGMGFGQTLRARWAEATGDDLADLRDKSPAEGADFK